MRKAKCNEMFSSGHLFKAAVCAQRFGNCLHYLGGWSPKKASLHIIMMKASHFMKVNECRRLLHSGIETINRNFE